MTALPPSINHIILGDLTDPERLADLYCQAVKQKYFSNSERELLEFFSLAEKSVGQDNQNTPEKLFAWQIRNREGLFISEEQEINAEKKLVSIGKRDVIDAAEDLLKQETGWRISADMGQAQEVFADEHLAFVPAVMTQVFFPQKPLPKGQMVYEQIHGNSGIFIQGGFLVKPTDKAPREDRPNSEACYVPSGSKARIILPYIVRYAMRNRTREIDMGHSLRQFMVSVGMPIGGKNAKEIIQQVKNIAAAHIVFGYWGEKKTSMRKEYIASAIDFWIERDERQATIWEPTIELGQNFYEACQVTNMPFLMPHIVQLSKSPRRMDLYMFLCHRTPRIPIGKEVQISLGLLQHIFAPDIHRLRDFRTRLRADLKAIWSVYPGFKAELAGDMLLLRKSIPPVQPSKRIIVP